MAESRKKIADRYEFDTRQHRPSWRRTKRVANGAGLLLAMLVCGFWIWRGDARTYQSHPVTDAHAAFGHDCKQCHLHAWQPALRLAAFGKQNYTVSEQACTECHAQFEDDHHREQMSSTESRLACAECHREHPANEGALVRVDSRRCTRCHENLSRAGVADAGAFQDVSGFNAAAHPEFAGLRATPLATDFSHGAHATATWKALAESPGAAAWRDHGGVKFNHAHHLKKVELHLQDGSTKRLDCAACHEQEEDNGLMKPVRYENHCAICHPLRLAGDLAFLAQIPHFAPEIVRGAVRERITRYVMQNTENNNRGQATPLRPLFPTPAPAKLSAETEIQVNQLMKKAEGAIFSQSSKGHCRKCHHLIAEDDSWRVLRRNPVIVAAQIVNASATHNGPANDQTPQEMVPSRWQKHAHFDHGRHETVDCAKCHQASQSTNTADILLPSIHVCFECHGSQATGVARPARSDCVCCHRYHDERHERESMPVLEDWLESVHTSRSASGLVQP